MHVLHLPQNSDFTSAEITPKILTFNKTPIEMSYDSVCKLNKYKIDVMKEQEDLDIVHESTTLE